jgi:hypothetical protein
MNIFMADMKFSPKSSELMILNEINLATLLGPWADMGRPCIEQECLNNLSTEKKGKEGRQLCQGAIRSISATIC